MQIKDFGVHMAATPACADLGVNEEKFECFTDSRGCKLCQYDYRDFDGELFSCVKASLQMCVEARNDWVLRKNVKKKVSVALIKLGVSGSVKIAHSGFRRYTVCVESNYFGVFDIDTNTFVD